MRYRVDMRAIRGELLTRAPFDDRTEAMQMFKALVTPSDDHVIFSTPYDALVVSLDEFSESDWVTVRRELVTRR